MKLHAPEQPLLFEPSPPCWTDRVRGDLRPYWFQCLRMAVEGVWRWRHHVDVSGWGVSVQGVHFALWLYKAGQITRERFKRYVRFFRAARQHEKRIKGKPCRCPRCSLRQVQADRT